MVVFAPRAGATEIHTEAASSFGVWKALENHPVISGGYLWKHDV